MPDVVTAEKGAPNFLYLGDSDPAKLGHFSGVTPAPIALEDAPTWYESADAGSERLTWGQYKGARWTIPTRSHTVRRGR